MTLDEFKRPYTLSELQSKFEENGFEAILWEFCVQMNRMVYEEELRYGHYEPEEGETIEELVAYLKEEESWTAETLREEVWNYAMKEAYVKAYLSQRNVGHGHEWSFIYTEQVRIESRNPSLDAYLKIKSKNESEAKREREIFIESFSQSKNPIFKKALTQSFGQGQTIEEDIDFARGVVYQYDRLLEAGCKSDEIYNYAQDLAEDHYDIYYRVYKTAIENGASSKEAYDIATKLEGLQVNGYLILETKSFCKEFNKTWQRELYYSLIMEKAAEDDEHWSVIDRNLCRENLGLPPLTEPLTAADEEFLRVKKALIEGGMNEVYADRKSHTDVYCKLETAPKARPLSETERFKQDITKMMYTNEEDYQD